jgi:cation:H+ antiporter
MSFELVQYLLLFSASLFVLIKGSDWFVRAAEAVGRNFGIQPFVIGVTIVAFGTSLPELATSIASVNNGDAGIVLGNVVGSNITNILLVLGLVAITRKSIKLDYNIMDIDMPLLLVSAVLMWYIVKDGSLTFFEALIFLGGLVIFLVNTLGNRSEPDVLRPRLNWKIWGLIVLGGVCVYFGAAYAIVSLRELAVVFGVGEGIVAQSLMALGTSLPEIMVSITAAKRGNAAIAVGNVLGSNIFNTYAVVAIPSFFGHIAVPDEMIRFGLPFMIAVTILFAVMCLSNRISRWEGSMLVFLYLFYLSELFQGQAI